MNWEGDPGLDVDVTRFPVCLCCKCSRDANGNLCCSITLCCDMQHVRPALLVIVLPLAQGPLSVINSEISQQCQPIDHTPGLSVELGVKGVGMILVTGLNRC